MSQPNTYFSPAASPAASSSLDLFEDGSQLTAASSTQSSSQAAGPAPLRKRTRADLEPDNLADEQPPTNRPRLQAATSARSRRGGGPAKRGARGGSNAQPRVPDSAPGGIGPTSSASAAQQTHAPSSQSTPAPPPASTSTSAPATAFDGSPLDLHADMFHSKSKGVSNRLRSVWPFWFAISPSEDVLKARMITNHNNRPALPSKPKPSISPSVGCKLCLGSEDKIWFKYVNNDGVVSNMRRHLESLHREEFEAFLKATNDPKLRAGKTSVEPWSLAGFYERLLKYIVATDKSFNDAESPELRELLLFTGQGVGLTEDQLLDQKQLLEQIIKGFAREREALIQDMKQSKGRVSLTSDCWTDVNLRAFMAVTAHWISLGPNGVLELKSALVAFRHMEGSHSGENMGNTLFTIIKELELTHKLGSITLDNATNNNTMMAQLETLCGAHEPPIPFHRDGNRVRCFPHVMNRAVVAILEGLDKDGKLDKILADLDSWIDAQDFDTEESISWASYRTALSGKVAPRARKLVAAFRVSDQRRADLHDTIKKGNEAGSWPTDFDEMFSEAISTDNESSEDLRCNGKLPLVQLLRDCETRWSSTFLLIVRLLVLYPALRRCATESGVDSLQEALLTSHECRVLRDIFYILRIPHAVQELMSAEKTPTLAFVVPLYHRVIDSWKSLKLALPHLATCIDLGIEKLEEYINHARKTQAYAVAMALNPEVKFSWIDEHWSPAEARDARTWVLNHMIQYRRHQRSLTRASAVCGQGPGARAAAAQQSGLQRIKNLGITPLMSHNRQQQPPQSQQQLSEEEEARQDRIACAQELQRWELDGLVVGHSIMGFWSLRNDCNYPTLYHVALDVLPMQASSVSCERVFSSSKQTVTLIRSRLSSRVIEMLQILKYRFRQERIAFKEDTNADKDDYTIDGPLTEHAFLELLRDGKTQELSELVRNSNDISY